MFSILLCRENRNINDAWITTTYKGNRAVTIITENKINQIGVNNKYYRRKYGKLY